MAILRTENLVVDHGRGVLDVRGNDFDTALLIGGHIVAYQWCDCQGSVGQYLVRSTSLDSTAAVLAFRHSVVSEVPAGVSLATHFVEIVGLLADGTYTLQLEDLPAETDVAELEVRQGSALACTNYYPSARSLIASQPDDVHSPAAVREHLHAIQRGARPTVVTLSAGDAPSEFILDGHHKIKAYRKASVPIRSLSIFRLDSGQVGLGDALAFLPDCERPAVPSSVRVASA